jgi:siroheme synthase-like protein
VSAIPIALEGSRITALVVGGGKVGTRKAAALVAAGSRVRIVSPDMTPELESLAASSDKVTLIREKYDSSMLGDELIIIAATSSAKVNAKITADANARGALVNRADAPDESDFHTMAVHRCGDIVVGVVAGGVPAAAARIRDAIAKRIDGRYAGAIASLRRMRFRAQATKPEEWAGLQEKLIGPEFCKEVESGKFAEDASEWV